MNRRLLATPLLMAGLVALAGCGPSAGQGGAEPPTTGPEATAAGLPATAESLAQPTPLGGAPASAGAAQTAAEAFVDGGPRFVAAKALIEAMDSGQVDIQIVDARTASDFEFGHIPGAVNVPYFEPEKHADALSKDKWIVTYCECPHAEAEQVANYLEQNGFTKVRVIDEGLQGWKDAGREVVGGTS